MEVAVDTVSFRSEIHVAWSAEYKETLNFRSCAAINRRRPHQVDPTSKSEAILSVHPMGTAIESKPASKWRDNRAVRYLS